LTGASNPLARGSLTLCVLTRSSLTSRLVFQLDPAQKRRIVARTIYTGPFGRLPAAWAEFNEWIALQGHTPGDDVFERLLSDPPARSRLELNRPLIL
jgi:hypothetical protein